MQPFYYVLTLVVMFGTPLIIFGLKYWSAAYQARAKAKADEAYRELAQKAVVAQSESAGALSAIQNDVAQIAARLTAVEKILKAVE
jgi:hypothetical protein